MDGFQKMRLGRRGAPSWISRIEIFDLFREFSYDIKLKTTALAAKPLLIIYGENGSGKTTILRLVYHLLSPIQGMGHKTFISRIPFRELRVSLNNGICVAAIRQPGIQVGPYDIRITEDGAELVNEHLDINPDAPPKDLKPIVHILKGLESLGLSYYLLSDDRSLDVSSAYEVRRSSLMRPPSNSQKRSETPTIEVMLHHALERLSDWIRRKIIRATRAGEQSVNDLYLKVLRRVAAEAEPTPDIDDVFSQIEALTARNDEFEPLGLSARLSLEPIKDALAKVPASRRDIISQVGSLYLESVANRLDQLQEVRDLMASIESALNSFFYRKSVKIDPVSGFVIYDSKGNVLQPEVLSSGEKHLLLLVCNVIVAREEKSVFFVDEPELSLNIKWQRKLIPTLLDFSKGGSNQFVFSTHSLEVLAQSEENVIRLAPVEG